MASKRFSRATQPVKPFVHRQLHVAHRGGTIAGAQHQLAIIQQVQQAGVAFHELHHQRDHAVESILELGLPHQVAADLLQQTQLLLGALQALF
jgi:hypothetical protein